MKLWLDDLRNPADHVGAGWTWAKTAAEAIDILASRTVEEISLDYDLEPGGYACIDCCNAFPCTVHVTGMAVVAWLVEHPRRAPPRMLVHTANTFASKRMFEALGAAFREADITCMSAWTMRDHIRGKQGVLK